MKHKFILFPELSKEKKMSSLLLKALFLPVLVIIGYMSICEKISGFFRFSLYETSKQFILIFYSK